MPPESQSGLFPSLFMPAVLLQLMQREQEKSELLCKD